jgi:hypothetical protein
MSNSYPPAKPIGFWKRFKPTECRTSDDWQTARQATAIRAISNSQCIDADLASQHLFECNSIDLNRSASNTFIDWLKAQPRQLHPSHALNFCKEPECYQLLAVSGVGASCSNGHFFEVVTVGEVA